MVGSLRRWVEWVGKIIRAGPWLRYILTRRSGMNKCEQWFAGAKKVEIGASPREMKSSKFIK